MQLHLVDIDGDLVAAWKAAFRDVPDVQIHRGEILSVATCAIGSPANSYGHMDGGIDADYAAFFGVRVQRAVYDRVASRRELIIPVGAAEVVATGHLRIPWLVLAPTMEVPEQVPPANAYRALRAALRAVGGYADRITDLYCPGLGTGVGTIAPDDAAIAMAEAYRDWLESIG